MKVASKVFIGMFLAFVSLLIPLTSTSYGVVAATGEVPYSIHIQKYAMDEEQMKKIARQDGRRLDETGFSGYEPVAGAQYRIQSAIAKGEIDTTKALSVSDFEITPNFDQTITTDQEGMATLSSATNNNFKPGFYLVSEVKNEVVQDPMKQVMVQLPAKDLVSGETLNEIYLYPKSGVNRSNIPPNPPDTGHNPPPTPPTVPPIPQTGGELQGRGMIASYAGVILVLGFTTIVVWKKGHRN